MDDNNTIFIGDLSYFCTKRDLEELFCSYGRIVNIRIKQNEGKKKSLSFGFVQFATHEEAINALTTLNGQMFLGRLLRLGWASDVNLKSKKIPSVAEDLKAVQILVSFISRQIKLLVTEETIRDICSIYGYVTDATIKKSKIDKPSSTQTGYGFVNFENTTEGINSALTAITQLRDCTIDDITYDCGLSDSLKRYFYNLKLQNDDILERLNIDMELLNKATFGAEVPMNEPSITYSNNVNYSSANNNYKQMGNKQQQSRNVLAPMVVVSSTSVNPNVVYSSNGMQQVTTYPDSNYYAQEPIYTSNYSVGGGGPLNTNSFQQPSMNQYSMYPSTVATDISMTMSSTAQYVPTPQIQPQPQQYQSGEVGSYDTYQYDNYNSNQYPSSMYSNYDQQQQQYQPPQQPQQHSSYQYQNNPNPSSNYNNTSQPQYPQQNQQAPYYNKPNKQYQQNYKNNYK